MPDSRAPWVVEGLVEVGVGVALVALEGSRGSVIMPHVGEAKDL